MNIMFAPGSSEPCSPTVACEAFQRQSKQMGIHLTSEVKDARIVSRFCLLQIFHVYPPLVLKSFTQDVSNGNRTPELPRPGCPRTNRARALIAVLAVENIIHRLDLVPSRPALGLDDIAEPAVLEHDPRELPPRPAEHGGPDAAGSGYVRIIEDVERLVLLGLPSVGGDVPRADGLDVAALEPRGGAQAEDEVDGAVDVGLCVDLVALVRVDGVLVARELAGVEGLVGVLGGEGEGLAAAGGAAEGVGHVQVVYLDVVVPEPDRRRLVIVDEAGCVAGEVAGDGDLVVRVAVGVAGVALQDEGPLQGGDVDLLRVGSREQEDGLLGRGVLQGGDGAAQVSEAVGMLARCVDDQGAVCRAGPGVFSAAFQGIGDANGRNEG